MLLKDVRETESASQDIAARVQAIRLELKDLEAEVERWLGEQTDASARVAELEWQLATTERERDKLKKLEKLSGVEPAAHEQALAEIDRLRREVELYQFDRSLLPENDRRSLWRFLLRR